MNQDQAEQVLKAMAATWPGELTDDRIVAWADTLREMRPGHAREAIRNLKRVKTFIPSHAEFFEAVEAIVHREALQHEELMAGEPGGDICECEGNGWIEVDRIGQGHVVRCERCNPPPPTRDAQGAPVEHKAGCSCARCFYGPKRFAAIAAGRDGMPGRRAASFDGELNRERFATLRDGLAKMVAPTRRRPSPPYEPADVVAALADKLRSDAEPREADVPPAPPPDDAPPRDEWEPF